MFKLPKMSSKNNHTIILLTKLSIFLQRGKRENQSFKMVDKPLQVFSNSEIIDGIIKGDLVIYKYIRNNSFPFLMQWLNDAASKRKAEEIIQNALIILYRKITTRGLILQCGFITYFLAVCKKIWIYEVDYRKIAFLEDDRSEEIAKIDDQEIENLYLESKEFKLYRRHFNGLKKKQQLILEASIDGIPYDDLFKQFGYSSISSFKNEVCRIRKILKERIISDPCFKILKDKSNWSL
jgi:hypothetical protein